MGHHGRLLMAACFAMITLGECPAGEPAVALRAEHFTVPPSTGPVTHVVVANLLDTPYKGVVRLKLPAGWLTNPAEREVELGPRETKRVPFAVEKAVDLADNVYAVEVSAVGGGGSVVRKQSVWCVSAPYFKPKIDASLKEWDDAIPVTFTSNGKKTTVRTYWNKRNFCLAVEVEEAKLLSYAKTPGPGGFDAVQFALATGKSITGKTPDAEASRYEFLIVDSGSIWRSDKCFRLARPGMKLALTQGDRSLADCAFNDAEVAVKRSGNVTRYECAIPFSAMKTLKPTEGRELRFSILIHDPDGTGVRDWGRASGLWPTQRNRLAWSTWRGAKWGELAPFDGKIELGLCSSKH